MTPLAQSDSHVRGISNGWSVYKSTVLQGVWRWSAYGPNGSTHGTAPSEAEAIRRAKASVESLNFFKKAGG